MFRRAPSQSDRSQSVRRAEANQTGNVHSASCLGVSASPSAIKHHCVGELWEVSCEAAKLGFLIRLQQDNRHGLKAWGTDFTTTPQLIHCPPGLLALFFFFFFTVFGCERCHFLVLLHCDYPTSSLAAVFDLFVFLLHPTALLTMAVQVLGSQQALPTRFMCLNGCVS